MYLFSLFLIFISIFEGNARHHSRTNASLMSGRKPFKHPSRICETSKMDVHLIELSGFILDREHEGFIDITLPTSARRPLFVCFPLYFQQYQQTYLLAHAACRQLGYATATTIVGKRIPIDSFAVEGDDDIGPTPLPLPLPKGLSPVSWNCLGYEQSISQCAWNNIRIMGCQMLTELACGECHRNVKAQSGFLKSPGYPVARFYDMMCEWHIEVPESHFISLIFHYLNNLPSKQQSEFHCATDKPYVDIMYGAQGSFHVRRHCDFKRLQNVTIPHHKVQIRFFSGLYNPRDINIHNNEQGIAISFKALSNEPNSLTMDIFIVGIIILIGLAGVIFFIRKTVCSMRKKHDRVRVGADELVPNVPGIEDLDKAYEFQRCKIQPGVQNKPGLRLRSNGSRSKLPSFRSRESSVSNRLLTTFRKFSSNSYTPRTIIPASLKSNQSKKAKLQVISNLKTNLLDRYSSGSHSTRKDSHSSVFFPSSMPFQKPFDFPIYHSTSSSSRQELHVNGAVIPPQETAI